MTKCSACIEWEAKGGTVLQCNTCAIHQPPAMLPQSITRERFIAAVGSEPVDDDLDRCNCPDAGKLGHSCCGWDAARELPKFMCLGLPDPQPTYKYVKALRTIIVTPPLTEREQRLRDMGNQIGRAVDRLSTHEPRLGAARFHPEV